MTNRVRGKSRYGLWVVVAVLVGGLLCQSNRADAAKNYRTYSANTTVEGQVYEGFLVTGWFGWMTVQSIVTVPPTPMEPVIFTFTVLPGFDFSVYMYHEHSFTPSPTGMGATGNTRDAIFWVGSEYWELSSIKY